MTADVTPDELESCLKAISHHAKCTGEVRRPPGEVYTAPFPGGRFVYINFIKPSAIQVGSVYRTWIVQLLDGKVDNVNYFRSRRGERGDDTLPPDDE